VKPYRFYLLSLVLFVALWCRPCALAEDWYAQLSSSSYKTQYGRLKITNSSAHYISCAHWSSGSATASLTSGAGDWTLTGVPAGFTLNRGTGYSTPAISTGIAPGASGYVYFQNIFWAASSGTANAAATMTLTLPYAIKKTSESLWSAKTFTVNRPVTWKYHASNVGIPTGDVIWGEYVYTGTLPDAGTVRVTPKNAGWVTVYAGATKVLDLEMKAGQTSEWSTSIPSAFDGQHLTVTQDGVKYYDVVIYNMREGQVSPETGLPLEGYEFTFEFTWDASGQPDDDDGDSVADDPPEVSRINPPPDAPANTVPGQYSGRSPGSPGVDAKTNTTAPDTTKEMYEAVRQGTEDAMNGNAGIDGNVAKADVGNGKGTSLGNAFGGGFAALEGVASVSLPSVGYATVSSMEVPFIFGHTLVLGVPSWAYLIKWFCSAITIIFGLVTFVKIVRSIFV